MKDEQSLSGDSLSGDAGYLGRAIELSRLALKHGGGPFGAVIVKGDEIVGEGRNEVTLINDPTAHAEVLAIRNACRALKTFQLDSMVLYASCEPCPMCLGAILWSRISRVVYANSRKQAAEIGFDDAYFYQEVCKPTGSRDLTMSHLKSSSAIEVLQAWNKLSGKIVY